MFGSRIGYLTGLLLASLVLTIVPAKADTIYDDLTGAIAHGGYVFGQYSPGTTYVIGAAFTPGQNYRFDQFQGLLSLSQGVNDAVISLYADSGNVPGTLLESWHLVNVLTSAAAGVTLNSVSYPALVGGQQYWITASMADPTSTGVWWINDNVRGIYTASLNGGAFTPGFSALFQAFSVSGTPTAAPEPANVGLALLGTIVLAFCLYRKRRETYRSALRRIRVAGIFERFRKNFILRNFKGAIFVSLFSFGVSTALGSTYNPFADFSTVTNPNGVWSYGTSSTVGGSFTPFTYTGSFQDIPSLPGWEDFARYVPTIAKNVSGSAVHAGTGTIPAGYLLFHPGFYAVDQYAVLRFTAPSAGLYNLAGLFQGLDRYPTTTDNHVVVDGASVFDGTTFSFGATNPFALSRVLSGGDTVDFLVGTGGNGNTGDEVGFQAMITNSTPEPTSAWLLLGGLAGVGVYVTGHRRTQSMRKTSTTTNLTSS